jgi:hypothetical protein
MCLVPAESQETIKTLKTAIPYSSLTPGLMESIALEDDGLLFCFADIAIGSICLALLDTGSVDTVPVSLV